MSDRRPRRCHSSSYSSDETNDFAWDEISAEGNLSINHETLLHYSDVATINEQLFATSKLPFHSASINNNSAISSSRLQEATRLPLPPPVSLNDESSLPLDVSRNSSNVVSLGSTVLHPLAAPIITTEVAGRTGGNNDDDDDYEETTVPLMNLHFDCQKYSSRTSGEDEDKPLPHLSHNNTMHHHHQQQQVHDTCDGKELPNKSPSLSYDEAKSDNNGHRLQDDHALPPLHASCISNCERSIIPVPPAASQDAVSLGSVLLELCLAPSDVIFKTGYEDEAKASPTNWSVDDQQLSSQASSGAQGKLSPHEDMIYYHHDVITQEHDGCGKKHSSAENYSLGLQEVDVLPLPHASIKYEGSKLSSSAASHDAVSLGSVLKLCLAPSDVIFKTGYKDEAKASPTNWSVDDQQLPSRASSGAQGKLSAHKDMIYHHHDAITQEHDGCGKEYSSAENHRLRLQEVDVLPLPHASIKYEGSVLLSPAASHDAVSLGSVLELCLAPTDVTLNTDYEDDVGASSTYLSVDCQHLSSRTADDETLPPSQDVEEHRAGQHESANESNAGATVMPGAIRVRGLDYAVSSSASEFDHVTIEPSIEGGTIPLSSNVIATLVNDENVRQSIRQNILENVVVADDFQHHPNVDDPGDGTQPSKRITVRHMVCLGVLVVVLLIAVAATIGSTISKKNHGQTTPTSVRPIPTSAPTPLLSRLDAFRALLLNNSVSSWSALVNVSSPQYRALKWLAEEDKAALPISTPFVVIKERFILSILSFANNDSSWMTSYRFRTSNGICLWIGVTCNPDNLVQELRLNSKSDMLQGPIPPEIGHLAQLRILQLINNKLEGAIPSEIGMCTLLEYLSLSENSLTGNLPSEIGLLNQLTQLAVDNNTLSGLIPSEIGMVANLEQLHVCENYFTGTLPTEIGLLHQVKEMEICTNELTGPIPSEIGAMTNLLHLYLDVNGLSESVPTEIGMLQQLSALGASFNELTGILPDSLGLLEQLKSLDVSTNLLHGTVPTVLAILPNLDILRVERNNFTGNLTNFFCDRKVPLSTFASDCRDRNIIDCLCCTVCCERDNQDGFACVVI